MNTPVWVVKDVTAQPDYTLSITFADGEQKLFDARPLLNKTIYAALKNQAFFLSARAEYGTVIWNDDIDIAPEYLYEYSLPASKSISE